MLLAATFSAAMLAWWIWHDGGRKLWLAVFYALLGAGALAKGPVAPALAVLIVGGYAALRRDAEIFFRSLWLPGFAIFAAVVLPWFIAVQIKVPEFFRVFFLEHNLQRFGTNLYQHAQPFWYYIPVFVLGTLPWTVFTLLALWDAIRRGTLRARGRAEGDQEDWLTLFLLIWVLVPILFFSISRSKLPGYILPAIPAAALLTAIDLQRAQ